MNNNWKKYYTTDFADGKDMPTKAVQTIEKKGNKYVNIFDNLQEVHHGWREYKQASSGLNHVCRNVFTIDIDIDIKNPQFYCQLNFPIQPNYISHNKKNGHFQAYWYLTDTVRHPSDIWRKLLYFSRQYGDNAFNGWQIRNPFYTNKQFKVYEVNPTFYSSSEILDYFSKYKMKVQNTPQYVANLKNKENLSQNSANSKNLIQNSVPNPKECSFCTTCINKEKREEGILYTDCTKRAVATKDNDLSVINNKENKGLLYTDKSKITSRHQKCFIEGCILVSKNRDISNDDIFVYLKERWRYWAGELKKPGEPESSQLENLVYWLDKNRATIHPPKMEYTDKQLERSIEVRQEAACIRYEKILNNLWECLPFFEPKKKKRGTMKRISIRALHRLYCHSFEKSGEGLPSLMTFSSVVKPHIKEIEKTVLENYQNKE